MIGDKFTRAFSAICLSIGLVGCAGGETVNVVKVSSVTADLGADFSQAKSPKKLGGTLMAPILNADTPLQGTKSNVYSLRSDSSDFISAALTNGGGLKFLKNGEGVSEYTCPSNLAGLTDGWGVFSYWVSNSAAASFNLYAAGELSANDKVMVWHQVYYKDIIDVDGYTVMRCGAGVKLVLKVSGVSGDVKASLPFLAASAELGHASVELKFNTFGLSGAAISALIPDSTKIGNFNTNGYAEIFKAIDSIRDAVADPSITVSVSPRPIAIGFPTIDSDGVDHSLAQAYALKFLSQGKKCSVAKAGMPDPQENYSQDVELAYNSIAEKCSRWSSPSDKSKADALERLQRFGF